MQFGAASIGIPPHEHEWPGRQTLAAQEKYCVDDSPSRSAHLPIAEQHASAHLEELLSLQSSEIANLQAGIKIYRENLQAGINCQRQRAFSSRGSRCRSGAGDGSCASFRKPGAFSAADGQWSWPRMAATSPGGNASAGEAGEACSSLVPPVAARSKSLSSMSSVALWNAAAATPSSQSVQEPAVNSARVVPQAGTDEGARAVTQKELAEETERLRVSLMELWTLAIRKEAVARQRALDDAMEELRLEMTGVSPSQVKSPPDELASPVIAAESKHVRGDVVALEARMREDLLALREELSEIGAARAEVADMAELLRQEFRAQFDAMSRQLAQLENLSGEVSSLRPLSTEVKTLKLELDVAREFFNSIQTMVDHESLAPAAQAAAQAAAVAAAKAAVDASLETVLESAVTTAKAEFGELAAELRYDVSVDWRRALEATAEALRDEFSIASAAGQQHLSRAASTATVRTEVWQDTTAHLSPGVCAPDSNDDDLLEPSDRRIRAELSGLLPFEAERNRRLEGSILERIDHAEYVHDGSPTPEHVRQTPVVALFNQQATPSVAALGVDSGGDSGGEIGAAYCSAGEKELTDRCHLDSAATAALVEEAAAGSELLRTEMAAIMELMEAKDGHVWAELGTLREELARLHEVSVVGAAIVALPPTAAVAVTIHSPVASSAKDGGSVPGSPSAGNVQSSGCTPSAAPASMMSASPGIAMQCDFLNRELAALTEQVARVGRVATEAQSECGLIREQLDSLFAVRLQDGADVGSWCDRPPGRQLSECADLKQQVAMVSAATAAVDARTECELLRLRQELVALRAEATSAAAVYASAAASPSGAPSTPPPARGAAGGDSADSCTQCRLLSPATAVPRTGDLDLEASVLAEVAEMRQEMERLQTTVETCMEAQPLHEAVQNLKDDVERLRRLPAKEADDAAGGCVGEPETSSCSVAAISVVEGTVAELGRRVEELEVERNMEAFNTSAACDQLRTDIQRLSEEIAALTEDHVLEGILGPAAAKRGHEQQHSFVQTCVSQSEARLRDELLARIEEALETTFSGRVDAAFRQLRGEMEDVRVDLLGRLATRPQSSSPSPAQAVELLEDFISLESQEDAEEVKTQQPADMVDAAKHSAASPSSSGRPRIGTNVRTFGDGGTAAAVQRRPWRAEAPRRPSREPQTAGGPLVLLHGFDDPQ